MNRQIFNIITCFNVAKIYNGNTFNDKGDIIVPGLLYDEQPALNVESESEIALKNASRASDNDFSVLRSTAKHTHITICKMINKYFA